VDFECTADQHRGEDRERQQRDATYPE